MVELKKGRCWEHTSESVDNRKIEDRRSENGTGKGKNGLKNGDVSGHSWCDHFCKPFLPS